VPICHDRKFIFYHIPRCGGTSLESFFQFRDPDSLFGVIQHGHQTLTLHHLTAVDLRRTNSIDNETLSSYFKFTIIRDPFNRMASDFHWQQVHDAHKEFSNMNFASYLDMAENVIRNERYFEKIHYDHFRPMADYCIEDGKLLVDDILLLENIENELHRIRSKVGKIDLPYLNQSPSYEDLRTTRNIDRVYKLYECDKVLYDNIHMLLS
jgi:hypothetical protein